MPIIVRTFLSLTRNFRFHILYPGQMPIMVTEKGEVMFAAGLMPGYMQGEVILLLNFVDLAEADAEL